MQAFAAREDALSQVEDASIAAEQLQLEVTDARAALQRAREETQMLKASIPPSPPSQCSKEF